MTTSRRLTGPVQWYGGKGQLAPRLLKLLPEGEGYCEPYGGAAALLFAKEPSRFEVYNDVNGDLVNLFRALRDPLRFERLCGNVETTLYARGEFIEALNALESSDDPDERAWAFYVAMNQAFGGVKPTPGRWSRSTSPAKARRDVSAAVSRWLSRLDNLPMWHERLSTVQIDQRDAIDIIRTYDDPDMVFYVDPPYVRETRNGDAYAFEVDDPHHERLIDALLSIEGKALVSGYNHPIYEPLERGGWEVHDLSFVARGQLTDKSKSRIERAWVKL